MKKDFDTSLCLRTHEDPFALKMGVKLLELRPGYARLQMEVKSDMTNHLETAHGGALSFLADAALAAASNSHQIPSVVLNLSLNFLSAPPIGAQLTAEAQEVHLTKRTGHYRITIVDGEGKLVASGTGIVYRKSG